MRRPRPRAGQVQAVDGGGVHLAGQSYNAWDGPGGEAPLHAFSDCSSFGPYGVWDVFALSLSPGGGYAWHAFYGCANVDSAMSAAADGSGGVCIAWPSGESWDGPDGESPLHAHSDGSDLFVLKLAE